jgi:hypothetical protein
MEFQHAPPTLEVLQAKDRTSTPYPFITFTFEFVVEYNKEFGGVSQLIFDDILKIHPKRYTFHG